MTKPEGKKIVQGEWVFYYNHHDNCVKLYLGDPEQQERYSDYVTSFNMDYADAIIAGLKAVKQQMG